MISSFRAFAKSPFAIGLIGLLIIGFAMFGISDVFKQYGSGYVLEAGDQTLTPAQFAREFNAEKEQAEKRVGQPIPVDMAVERGFDRQLLEQMAGRESLAALIHRIGVRVSDEQVAADLAKIPAFFDSITGKFDQQLYLSKLAEKNLSGEEYEGMVRNEKAMQQVIASAIAGFKAPRAYAALGGAYALESRDISFFVVDPRDIPPPKEPTDAQLKAFIEEHAQALTRPEMRQITLVRFSADDMEKTVDVSEAQVRKRFEERKASMIQPQLRTVVQITANDAAGARKVRQMLVEGASPATAAKAVGTEPLTYSAKPKAAIVDRKVAEVAYSLDEGQVSEPIQGELGYAVVKVEDITPGHTPTFEEVRADIAEAMRKDAALAKAYEQTQAYDDAHAAGANLAEAARKAGVQAQTFGPMTAQGQRLQAEKADLPEQVLKTAFDLAAGAESEIEETERGEYYALKVDKVIPAAVPPLDEIRPQLSQRYMMDDFVKRMQARADALAEKVKKGESLAAVAKSAGANVNTVPGITRAEVQKYQSLGSDLLGKAISGKEGDVFVAQGQQFGFAVVRLDKVEPAKAGQVAPLLDQQRNQISGDLFNGLQRDMIEYAKRQIKPHTDLDLARRAIGVDPATAPDPAKAAATVAAADAKPETKK